MIISIKGRNFLSEKKDVILSTIVQIKRLISTLSRNLFQNASRFKVPYYKRRIGYVQVFDIASAKPQVLFYWKHIVRQ